MTNSWNTEFFRQEFAAAKSALVHGVEPSETTGGLNLSIAVAVRIGCRYLFQNLKGELAIKYGARNQVNLEQGKQHLTNTLAEVGSTYEEAVLLDQLLDLRPAQRVQPIVNYIQEVGKGNVGAWVTAALVKSIYAYFDQTPEYIHDHKVPTLAAGIYFYLDQTPENQQGHQARQAWKSVARRANRGDLITQLPEVLNQPTRTPKTTRGFKL